LERLGQASQAAKATITKLDIKIFYFNLKK
jgi:hypothetical protein